MDSAETGVRVLSSELADELRVDPNAFLRFYQYLRTQFCLEAMNFFLEVEEYASFPQNVRLQKEQSIVDKYITVGSPQQVNINHQLRKDVLTNVGLGKAQLFTAACNQVMKLVRLNVWYDFQSSPDWALTLKAKPLKGKQLKKAFIRVLDADVVPAAVFVYTGKRMSRQDLVQLKMEGYQWLLDTSNEHMSLVLHDALSVDLDLPAIQSLFYLLSLQPKVLLQFFKHTATSDIYLNAAVVILFLIPLQERFKVCVGYGSSSDDEGAAEVMKTNKNDDKEKETTKDMKRAKEKENEKDKGDKEKVDGDMEKAEKDVGDVSKEEADEDQKALKAVDNMEDKEVLIKDESAAKDKLARGRNGRKPLETARNRSPSPSGSRIFPRSGLSTQVITEYFLFTGDAWLKKALKKIVAIIYKHELVVDTGSIPRFSSLPKEEQKSLNDQTTYDRAVAADLATTVLTSLIAKPSAVPPSIVKVLQAAFHVEKNACPERTDDELLIQGPGQFLVATVVAVLGSPLKVFAREDLHIQNGVSSRRSAVAVADTLASLVEDEEPLITVPPLVLKMHAEFKKANLPLLLDFLKALNKLDTKEHAVKGKPKEITLNVNTVGHYLNSHGPEILKRFTSTQLGVLKDFITTNLNKKTTLKDENGRDLLESELPLPEWFTEPKATKTTSIRELFTIAFKPRDQARARKRASLRANDTSNMVIDDPSQSQSRSEKSLKSSGGLKGGKKRKKSGSEKSGERSEVGVTSNAVADDDFLMNVWSEESSKRGKVFKQGEKVGKEADTKVPEPDAENASAVSSTEE